MDTYLLDWANLLLRWAHVIVAIAWIGSSFYFVFLDNSLTPPQDPVLQDKGVTGELWAVHGGGCARASRYAALATRRWLPLERANMRARSCGRASACAAVVARQWLPVGREHVHGGS